MYLPDFAYHRPRSLDEALELKGRQAEALWYAGGTEVVALMKLGLAQPPALIDLKAIPELRLLDPTPDRIAIGATVTHRALERDRRVREVLPVLAAVEHQVANVRVRNFGSLAGGLCFAEPHSDPAPLLLALDAEVTLVSSRGARSVPLGDFIVGPFTTSIAPDEVLTRIDIPRPSRVRAARVGRRAFRERPTVNAVVLLLDDGFRVAVGAAGPVPVRAGEAEALLDGAGTDAGGLAEVAAEAGRAAGQAVDAYDEAGASAEYKQHLTSVLVERAVRDLAAGLT